MSDFRDYPQELCYILNYIESNFLSEMCSKQSTAFFGTTAIASFGDILYLILNSP